MTAGQRDLYVGYLPLPPKHQRFLRASITTLVVALAGAGAVIAALQRDPGPALWDTANEISLTGRLSARPYPSIVTDDGAYLIVETGKIGPQRRLDPLHNHDATLTGYRLERAGRRMLELAPGSDAVRDLGVSARSAPTGRPGPEVELIGEILDSKCYLGAMKPGDGKAHKACATLCIDGGIPPMLYARNADGEPVYYVLCASDAAPAPESVRDYLAEPVRVRGVPIEADGLSYLVIDETSITRLGL